MDAAYTPTEFQKNTAPPELRHKITVLHEGVETELFQGRKIARPTNASQHSDWAEHARGDFVSRGLESVRGFDIFMKMAARIAKEIEDVVFLIAGTENTFTVTSGCTSASSRTSNTC